MTWTPTTLNILDGAGTSRPVVAYTDGTNYSFAHPLLDTTGAIIAPATSGAQTAGNTTLASILASLQTPLAPPPLVATAAAFTRPADTTAYAFGDLVANSTTVGSVTVGSIAAARGNNVPGALLRCRLQKSSTGITNANFRIHFYNALPTVSNGDNGAWLSTTSGYIGSMDVTIDKAFSDSSEGIGVPTMGASMAFTPVTGSQNLYYLIEARNSYTPASAETFTLIIEAQ